MKTFINTALLKEQLKRFWPIAAIAMLLYLLFIVQPIYFNARNIMGGGASATMVRLLTLDLNPIIFAMVVMPFCTVMGLFSYTFKTASTTAYHSLPVNRKQLFFTNGLAGLVIMLVPLLALCVILLVPVQFVEHSIRWSIMDSFAPGLADGGVINTLPRVAGFFLRSALGFTMYFAVLVLAVSLAGNFVTAVLIAGAIAVIPPALVGLGEIISEMYVFGWAVSRFNLSGIVLYFHPIFWSRAFGFTFVFGGTIRPVHHFYISYGLITAISLGLAYLAFRLRPQERAGDAVVFTPLKRLLIFLVAFAGMFFMGAVGLLTVGSRIGLYIGFVPGFAVAYFIAQMLAERTFRVGSKAKGLIPYGAVAVSIYALLLAVTNVGLWGYVRFVPQNREITGVHIMQGWSGQNVDRWLGFMIDDPATIARVQEVHQGIVDERRYLQREHWRNIGVWNMTPLNITYRLSDGRIIVRRYLVTRDFSYRWAIDELLQSEPVVLANFPSLRTPERIGFVEIIVRNEEYWDAMDGVTRIWADSIGTDAEIQVDYLQDIVYLRHRVFISETPQIVELAAAIQRDILISARSNDMIDRRNRIDIFVDIRGEYDMYTGGFVTNVRMDGYTADWLVDNGVLVEVLE